MRFPWLVNVITRRTICKIKPNFARSFQTHLCGFFFPSYESFFSRFLLFYAPWRPKRLAPAFRTGHHVLVHAQYVKNYFIRRVICIQKTIRTKEPYNIFHPYNNMSTSLLCLSLCVSSGTRYVLIEQLFYCFWRLRFHLDVLLVRNDTGILAQHFSPFLNAIPQFRY